MAKHRHDTETTRRELLDAGRAAFSNVGYAKAGTVEIVDSIGLTRGALYHHFENKEGLFLAVLQEVHSELASEVDRQAKLAKGGPAQNLRVGFHTWLDVVLQDNIRRILLVDGPAVIGWDKWHEIDLEHGFGVTRAALEKAMKDGQIAKAPLDELTHVLMGAVTQAGLELGRASDNAALRKRYRKVIDLLLDGLLI